jgi:CRISPR-associated protein Cmr4
MTKPTTTKTYFATALDPIHVGTGGYRLGRVDLSIVREPGTELPKIPGTSLNGVTRAYAAMATNRYSWTKTVKEKEVRGSCAGQGQSEGGHCGERTCPVCVAFGFARGNEGGKQSGNGSEPTDLKSTGSGFQGLAQFADARILFFPVHSMIGPVWITSPATLEEHGLAHHMLTDENMVKLGKGLTVSKNRLNLGWLMLQSDGVINLNDEALDNEVSKRLKVVPGRIRGRAVLVSEKLFSRLIRDNLEVRTSVSIDPATGAAEDGALFTFEAIPRGTVLCFPITYTSPALFFINGQPPAPTHNGQPIEVPQVVEHGLALLPDLGIGGMNTRGLGRLKVLNLNAQVNGQQTGGVVK